MAHEHTDHVSADDEYGSTPPGATYEHTDAHAGPIVRFIVWLAVSAIVIHIGMGFMYEFLIQRSMVAEHPYPLAVDQPLRLPPAPRLQQFPANDIYRFRTDEAALLERYGWLNKEAGVVHIPIEEAMRLTVERGLLQSRSPEAPQDLPGQMASDASAGRTMERRRQ